MSFRIPPFLIRRGSVAHSLEERAQGPDDWLVTVVMDFSMR